MKKLYTFEEAAQIIDKTVTDILDHTEPSAYVPLVLNLIKDLRYALKLRQKRQGYKNFIHEKK